MNQLSLYGWGMFSVYLFFLCWLAYHGAKKTRSLKDFITAPKSYGPILVGLALGATSCSAAATMGNPGLVYKFGWSGMWYGFGYGGMVAGTAISALMLSRLGSRLQARSMPDFLGKRFQSEFMRVFSALVAIILIYYIAGQFAGCGWVFAKILGMPSYSMGVIVASVIIGAYIAIGGTHADVLNCGIQGILMVIFACIVIFVTSYFIGGIGTINSMVEAQDPGLGWSSFFNGPFFGPFTGPAIMISLGLFTLGPQISKLWFCLDEERHVPHTILTYMVFMTLMFFMMLLAGLGARAVLPSIQPDLSSLLIISKFMPAPVVAFAGVGVIAAIMSTTAGLFLVIAIGIVNDIYKDTLVPHLWPNMSPATTDKRALLGTRILIPIVMIIGILISFHPPKLLTALIWVGLGGFTAAFAPVMVWGCLWRRTTKAGVITASIVGFACHCICYFVLGKIVGMSLFLVPWAGCGIGIIAGFILCPIVSLFTKPFSEEHLKVCFERQTDKESVGE